MRLAMNILTAFVSLALCGAAAAFASDFHIDWYTIDGGGGASTGGGYTLIGTIAQHDACAPIAGGGTSVSGGYWGFGGAGNAGACYADVAPAPDGDAIVDVNDLLTVITQWGACPVPPSACLGDIAPPGIGNGQVDVNDLLEIITAWGICPD
jgi:hypothetical protein